MSERGDRIRAFHLHDTACALGDCPESRHGLPYGWWKRPTFWVTTLVGIPAIAVYAFLLGAWFGVWS